MTSNQDPVFRRMVHPYGIGSLTVSVSQKIQSTITPLVQGCLDNDTCFPCLGGHPLVRMGVEAQPQQLHGQFPINVAT